MLSAEMPINNPSKPPHIARTSKTLYTGFRFIVWIFSSLKNIATLANSILKGKKKIMKKLFLCFIKLELRRRLPFVMNSSQIPHRIHIEHSSIYLRIVLNRIACQKAIALVKISFNTRICCQFQFSRSIASYVRCATNFHILISCQ